MGRIGASGRMRSSASGMGATRSIGVSPRIPCQRGHGSFFEAFSNSFHFIEIELNRFAVGVASGVSRRGALPKHNRYMVSERY